MSNAFLKSQFTTNYAGIEVVLIPLLEGRGVSPSLTGRINTSFGKVGGVSPSLTGRINTSFEKEGGGLPLSYWS